MAKEQSLAERMARILSTCDVRDRPEVCRILESEITKSVAKDGARQLCASIKDAMKEVEENQENVRFSKFSAAVTFSRNIIMREAWVSEI